MRIGIFASGPVGQEVTKILLAEPTAEIALLATTPDDADAFAAAFPDAAVSVVDRTLSTQQLAELHGAKLDLLLLAWWPYIIPRGVIEAAERGALNLHPSLLPHNRGKDPNFWAIVEGRPFGVTIHWVDDGVDTGDIAFQREIPVGWEDTGRTLYEEANAAIVDLVRTSLPEILRGAIPRIPQGDDGSFHRRSELDRASRLELDAETTPRELLNLVRARTFEPHPSAWFEDDGKTYEVRVSITEVQRRGAAAS